jgi:hypothetical protein
MNFGKKISDKVYFHKVNLLDIDRSMFAVVADAWDHAHYRNIGEYSLEGINVIRVAKNSVAFLRYSDFMLDQFPELSHSVTIPRYDGIGNRPTQIGHDKFGEPKSHIYNMDNPPIIHRKELMVKDPPTEWLELTRQLEDAGAYKETKSIGYKLKWQQRLNDLGIRVEGYKVVKCSGT